MEGNHLHYKQTDLIFISELLAEVKYLDTVLKGRKKLFTLFPKKKKKLSMPATVIYY